MLNYPEGIPLGRSPQNLRDTSNIVLYKSNTGHSALFTGEIGIHGGDDIKCQHR